MRALRGLVPLLVLVACKDELPLKEVSDQALGYAIRVPEGAKQIENGMGRQVWSWSPDENVNSYHCIIQVERGLDTFTPEAARKLVAEIRAPSDIKSVEPEGADGLLVEIAEDDHVHYRESWCYRRGKTKTMVAICSGPAKGSTVTAMAKSLRATQ